MVTVNLFFRSRISSIENISEFVIHIFHNYEMILIGDACAYA